MERKLLSSLCIFVLLASAILVSIPTVAQDEGIYQKAPINPDFLEFTENQTMPFYGYIPPIYDFGNINELPSTEKTMLQVLPSEWDWRTYNKVSPVKNQASCGTCWAFGTTSVLESTVLIGESTQYDFSEQSIALCVDRSWVSMYDDSTDPCLAGGNSFKASEVLIKKGAVLESCNPYNTSGLICDGSCDCDSCPSIKQASGYRFVTGNQSQIELIKAAVYNRPVTAAFYYSSSYEYWNGTWGPIYDYYPNTLAPNHMVSIIGWDDAVPHPSPYHSGTGAWLIKNSWGTSDPWAGGAGTSDGYFWLAYDSSSLREIAYVEYADFNDSERLYYLDEVGFITALGAGSSTCWMANIFTSEQNGALTHVDFYTTVNNAEYEIYVYNDSDLSNGLQNLLASKVGTCAEGGYYSIPLTTPVVITDDQQFTVAVKMTTPGFNFPIPVEMIISGVCEPPIQSGVSYLSLDNGATWDDASLIDITDYYDGFNACLRARITSGGSISGYVYEENGSTPIEGATVDAWDFHQGPPTIEPEFTAITDSNGYYTISNLDAGDYRISAFAPNHERLFYLDYNERILCDPVTVIESQNTSNVNFSLSPGGTISGTITAQEGGTPLEAVSVGARPPTPNTNIYSAALTDSNGTFTLDGLPYGSYVVASPIFVKLGEGDDSYIMEVWEEKTISGTADLVTVGEGNNPTGIDFTLEIGGTISGYVEDINSDPIINTLVVLWDYNSLQGQWLLKCLAVTDENGYYETTGLPPGLYAARAQCEGYALEWYNGTYYREEAAPIEVNESGNTPNINFTLEAGGSISGYVEDSIGNPIANLHTYAIDSVNNKWILGVNTGADGSYVLAGLPAGSYKVKACASCSGFNYVDEWYNNAYSQNNATPVTVVADDDTPNINFSLDMGGSIEGTVRDSDGSTALPNVSVECKRTIDGDRDWHGTTTDEQGNYEISGLPYGYYIVRAPSGGRWGAGDDDLVCEYYDNTANEGEATHVEISEIQDTVTDINFTLATGGSISGHVQDSLGSPIANLHLSAMDNLTEQWVAGTNTGADGTYVLVGLPAGNYKVKACASCDGFDYADEWYYNAYFIDDALPVTVVASEDTPNIDFILSLPVKVDINAPSSVPENVNFSTPIAISYVEHLNAVQYDVFFDPSVLQWVEITDGEIDSIAIPVDANEIEAGHWIVVQSLVTGEVSGSGDLSTIQFLSIGALDTSSNITLANGIISGMSGEIPATWGWDHVEISVIPGDANNDGNINVLDMTKVARIILQIDPSVPGADANQDGSVNVLDMTKIARIILHLDD